MFLGSGAITVSGIKAEQTWPQPVSCGCWTVLLLQEASCRVAVLAEAPLLGLILQRVNKLNPKIIHCCLLTANNSEFEVRWDHTVLKTLGSSTAPAEQGSFPNCEFACCTAPLPRRDPLALSGVRGFLDGPGANRYVVNVCELDLNGFTSLRTSTEKNLNSAVCKHTQKLICLR